MKSVTNKKTLVLALSAVLWIGSAHADRAPTDDKRLPLPAPAESVKKERRVLNCKVLKPRGTRADALALWEVDCHRQALPLLKSLPQTGDVLFYIGGSYYKLEEYAEAAEYFADSASTSHSLTAFAYEGLGQSKRLLGDLSAAKSALAQSRALTAATDAHYIRRTDSLAAVLVAAELSDEANAVYADAYAALVSQCGSDAKSLEAAGRYAHALAISSYNAGEYADASAWANKGIAAADASGASPSYRGALAALLADSTLGAEYAEVYATYKAGNYPAAVDQALAFLAEYSGSAFEASARSVLVSSYVAIGNKAAEDKSLDAARSAYANAVAQAQLASDVESESIAVYNLGVLEYNERNGAAAIAHFDRVIELVPGSERAVEAARLKDLASKFRPRARR